MAVAVRTVEISMSTAAVDRRTRWTFMDNDGGEFGMPRNKAAKKKRQNAAANEMRTDSPILKLLSNDGETIEVSYAIMCVSQRINVIMNVNKARGEGEEMEPINLDVDAETLRTIIHWCTYYKDHVMMPSAKERVIPRFDDELFEELDMKDFFSLVKAANYLKIRGLEDNAGKKIAGMIRGKTTEELRDLFNITNDFTPEEEDAIRSENLARSALGNAWEE